MVYDLSPSIRNIFEYKRKHIPAPARPARPLLCITDDWVIRFFLV